MAASTVPDNFGVDDDEGLAMALAVRGAGRLAALRLPPRPLAAGELRIAVSVCGVCRTDLHLVDDELDPAPSLPRVPGHEIVGRVVELGPDCHRFVLGDRVGVPWLHDACGHCRFCAAGRENLCPDARFTGWSVDGGYARRVVAREDFVVPIPPGYADEEAAPLLCAGLIGFRSWRMLGPPGPAMHAIGIYGFGAAGHLVAQIARAEGQAVYAFTRTGDDAAQQLARSLGAAWAGGSEETPPTALDGAVIFAPAGALVPTALRHVAPGGTVVCGGIHMSDIPSFPYRLLWMERTLRSVAHLTRHDAEDFMAWAGRHRLQTTTQLYPLADANRALDDLRAGRIAGAAVLRCAG